MVAIASRTAHRLIRIPALRCPECGATPSVSVGSSQRLRITGFVAEPLGHVQVCAACWYEWLASCPDHRFPRR